MAHGDCDCSIKWHRHSQYVVIDLMQQDAEELYSALLNSLALNLKESNTDGTGARQLCDF